MLGKRKRASSCEAQELLNNSPVQTDSPTTPPTSVFSLSRANLEAHNLALSQMSKQGVRTSKVTKATQSSLGDTSSIVSTASAAFKPNIDAIYATWDFYLDRHSTKPPALTNLIDRLKSPRTGPPTPKSKRVASLAPNVAKMYEMDSIKTLEKYLGYIPELEEGGEPTVGRVSDRFWREGCVPRPVNVDSAQEAALKSLGGSPRPKPDITYGYTDNTFTRNELHALRSVAHLMCISDAEYPWLPYFVTEWKSDRAGGTMHDAQRQAMRDGSAAVWAMHKFLVEAGFQTPPPEMTAMFSLCTNGVIAELRVHWRSCCAAAQELSWEADLLFAGFIRDVDNMFQLRCLMLNMLTWAREDRLDHIRVALSKVSSPSRTIGRAALPVLLPELASPSVTSQPAANYVAEDSGQAPTPPPSSWGTIDTGASPPRKRLCVQGLEVGHAGTEANACEAAE